MKKLLTAIVTAGMLASAGSVLAYTLTDGTGVGELDSYEASTSLANSGEETELTWVNSVLAPLTATFELKYEELSESSWQLAKDTSSVYALYLGSNNTAAFDYFLVKLGNNGTSPTDYLFKNNDELAWAVLDLNSSFDGAGIKNIEKISHVSLFDTGSTPVPEPSTLLMLGAGLLGLGLYGRRVQK